MCRRTLRRRIAEAAKEMKQKLVKTLGDQATVATTTDCRSAYGKSYIGVTVHWIDVGTLDRKSACLALRRLKGSHTYDVIATALNDIHAEYGIRKKVTRTTTDNGANYVKAFSVFAQMPRLLLKHSALALSDQMPYAGIRRFWQLNIWRA